VLDADAADVRASFRPGAAVTILAQIDGARRAAKVGRVEVAPRALEACKRDHFCAGRISISATHDIPDVALLMLEGDLSDLPSAVVDTTPVSEGDPLTMVGYGCLTGFRMADADGKLRMANVAPVAPRAVVHPGSFLSDGNEARLEEVGGNYVITPGPRISGRAGLCPGDSGGPLFRRGTNIVAGVNASYSFEPGDDVPVTNWHTRLDGRARHGIAAWLERQGATLTQPCAVAGCVSF
jgi:hypothetical protein